MEKGVDKKEKKRVALEFSFFFLVLLCLEWPDTSQSHKKSFHGVFCIHIFGRPHSPGLELFFSLSTGMLAAVRAAGALGNF